MNFCVLPLPTPALPGAVGSKERLEFRGMTLVGLLFLPARFATPLALPPVFTTPLALPPVFATPLSILYPHKSSQK
jgi:hypothetical protein